MIGQKVDQNIKFDDKVYYCIEKSYKSPVLKSNWSSRILKQSLLKQKTPLTIHRMNASDFKAKKYNINWVQVQPFTTTWICTLYKKIQSGNFDKECELKRNEILVDGWYTNTENEAIQLYHASHTKNRISLISLEQIKKYLVVSLGMVKRWRHSSEAIYIVFDIESLITSEEINGKTLKINDNTRIQKIKWDSNGNNAIIVAKDLVYTFNADEMKFLKIENQLERRYISNGIPDWIYEEEILATDNAIWTFPYQRNNPYTKFVYCSFDDKDVPLYKYPIYSAAKAKELNLTTENIDQYPVINSIPYPKPGIPLPGVKVWFSYVDFANDETYNIEIEIEDSIPSDLKSDFKEFIVQDIANSESSTLVRITNREQTKILTFYVDLKITSESHHNLKPMIKLLRFENTGRDFSGNSMLSDDGWYPTDIRRLNFLPRSEDRYLDSIIYKGYNHMAIFSINSGESNDPLEVLTIGNYDTDFISFGKDKIWYTSTEMAPISNNIYNIDYNGQIKQLLKYPIVKINDKFGLNIDTWTFNPSPLSGYSLLAYSGPDIPAYYLIDLHENKHDVLQDNEITRKHHEAFNIPYTVYNHVMIDGTRCDIKEIRPVDFDPKKKYNVILRVYGGPESQLVTSGYQMGLNQIMVSKIKDTVLVMINVPNSLHMDRKNQMKMKNHFGIIDVDQHVKVFEHWLINSSFANHDKVAIWGWSYGGYLTLKLLSHEYKGAWKGPKFGVSVAPVMKWRYYDSIYTERYLSLDKIKEFDVDSNLLMDKKFLLIHGTADDNVHIYGSIDLANSLSPSNDHFTTWFVQDDDHSISFGNNTEILSNKLISYFNENFSK